jgi:hypothetical protein
MDQTLNPVDIQNTIDNFEAVVKSGDVKLVAQNGDVKLYLGNGGVMYIYDGITAYSQGSEDFARLHAENFES